MSLDLKLSLALLVVIALLVGTWVAPAVSMVIILVSIPVVGYWALDGIRIESILTRLMLLKSL